jgi:hypothetical protein
MLTLQEAGRVNLKRQPRFLAAELAHLTDNGASIPAYVIF